MKINNWNCNIVYMELPYVLKRYRHSIWIYVRSIWNVTPCSAEYDYCFRLRHVLSLFSIYYENKKEPVFIYFKISEDKCVLLLLCVEWVWHRDVWPKVAGSRLSWGCYFSFLLWDFFYFLHELYIFLKDNVLLPFFEQYYLYGTSIRQEMIWTFHIYYDRSIW